MGSAGRYFEGILQLRPGRDDVLRFVRETVSREGKAEIVKEAKVKGGIDLYFSSQRYLRSFSLRLPEKFSGKLEMTRRLFTTSGITSKFVYRVTVLFRLLPFKRGDSIVLHGRKVRILAVRDRVQVQDAASGAKEWHALEEVERAFTAAA
jgi:NMD protein affecting ribosome stability and mRNA decay